MIIPLSQDRRIPRASWLAGLSEMPQTIMQRIVKGDWHLILSPSFLIHLKPHTCTNIHTTYAPKRHLHCILASKPATIWIHVFIFVVSLWLMKIGVTQSHFSQTPSSSYFKETFYNLNFSSDFPSYFIFMRVLPTGISVYRVHAVSEEARKW